MSEKERLAESLRAALADLGDVFTGIAETAEEKAFLRCPYMNVRRECTARFECINQDFSRGKGKRAICSGEHKINFACGEGPAEPGCP